MPPTLTATTILPPRRRLVPLSPSKRNATPYIYQPLDEIVNVDPPSHTATKPMRAPLATRRADRNASTMNAPRPEKQALSDEKKHAFTFHHPPPMTAPRVSRNYYAHDDKENATATATINSIGGGEGKRTKRKEPPVALTQKRPRFEVHRDAPAERREVEERRDEGRGSGAVKRRKAVKFQAPASGAEQGVASPRAPRVEDIIIDDITDPMEVDEQDYTQRSEVRPRERERDVRQQQQQPPQLKRRKTAPELKQSFPPSVLTTLLLSHTNPNTSLPELPSPPPSRLGSSPAGSRTVTPLPHRKSSLKPIPESRPPPPARVQPAPAPKYSTVPVAPLPDPAATNAPRTFTLHHLPQISHHTASLVLTLNPPTHVTLTIRHSNPPTVYTIYPENGGVTVHGEHFSLPELPWKHLSAYRYARRFVEFVASRTLVTTARVVGDMVGKLWADGRAEVEFPGGVMVKVSATGSASIGRGDMYAYHHHLEKAIEVWRWMLEHPDEPQGQSQSTSHSHSQSQSKDVPAAKEKVEKEDENGWEIDKNTRFVRGVGWCKAEEAKGKWWMRFLDGVRMLVVGDGRCRWWEPEEVVGVGRWRALREDEVRRRVAAFVEAGV